MKSLGSVLDVDNLGWQFETPVTRKWLLDNNFEELDITDLTKAFPEVEYIYIYRGIPNVSSVIEVSLSKGSVRFKVYNPEYGTTINPDGSRTVDYRPYIRVGCELGTVGELVEIITNCEKIFN